jgi:hypothetical protein
MAKKKTQFVKRAFIYPDSAQAVVLNYSAERVSVDIPDEKFFVAYQGKDNKTEIKAAQKIIDYLIEFVAYAEALPKSR